MKIDRGNNFNRIAYNGGNQAVPAKAQKEEKDWTVLLYLNGNNDIEKDVLNNFLTLEEVSEHQKMNLLAELGRSPQGVAHPSYQDNVDGDWNGVRRYEMQKGAPEAWPKRFYTNLGEHDGKIDSKIVADLGEADMSDKNHLADFLRWGIKNYPAKHYMVVLAGHGAGFLGSMPDYKTKDHMKLPETAAAFKEVQEETGIKPDMLVMDACLMGQAEAAHELKDAADMYVASEDLNWDCLPMQKSLQHARDKWDDGESVSPTDMANYLIIEGGDYNSIPAISAVNSNNLESFSGSMKEMADALLHTKTDPEIIRNVMKKTKHFGGSNEKVKPYSDYRDLGDFCNNVIFETNITDGRVKRAAMKVIDHLKSSVILKENHSQVYDENGRNKVHGMSIYMPTEGFNYKEWGLVFPSHTDKLQYEDIYRNLDFVKKTGWDKVIDKFAAPKETKLRGGDVLDSLISGKFNQ